MFRETVDAWNRLVTFLKESPPILIVTLTLLYIGFMYIWFFKIAQEDCIRKLEAWVRMCEENNITRLEFVNKEGPNLVLDLRVLNIYMNSIKESSLRFRAYRQLWKVSDIFSEENMEKCKEAVIINSDKEIPKQ